MDDKLVVVAARRVLTSMWVDITLVTFRCTRGVLYLGGRVQRMTASHSEMYLPALREMDKRLRGIRNVSDMKYHFENWRRNIDGGWIMTGTGTAVTFEIDDTLSPGA